MPDAHCMTVVTGRECLAMIDYSLQQLGLRLVSYVFIGAVHGFAVAASAVALGDPGPRHDRRLSINPLTHLDVIGTASGVLFSVGWIRPIVVDPGQLRCGSMALPRLGLVIIVLTGAAATLASAAMLRLVRPLALPLLSDTVSATAFALVETVSELSLWFALLNVLPLPPLTGAHLIAAINPAWRKTISRLAPYGAGILILLAATGLLTAALGPAYRALAAIFGQ
jgi:Zn-dependent protease